MRKTTRHHLYCTNRIRSPDGTMQCKNERINNKFQKLNCFQILGTTFYSYVKMSTTNTHHSKNKTVTTPEIVLRMGCCMTM